MELHQLRYFLAVFREGTFSRAAETLSLAQPSLSEQIRKLESELGSDLFERTSRRLIPTPAAEALRPYAERMLADMVEARARVHDVAALQGGRVRLGVLPSLGAHLMPDAIADFQRRYPSVEMQLVEGVASRTLAMMVEAGEIDIAVVRLEEPAPALNASLLLRDPMLALVPPDHPLAGRRRVWLSDLADEPFLTLKPGYGLRTLMLRLLEQAGIHPRIVLEVSQLDFLRGLVQAGMGVTVLPELACSFGEDTRVRIADRGSERELYLVSRAGSAPTPAVRAFTDIVRARTGRA